MAAENCTSSEDAERREQGRQRKGRSTNAKVLRCSTQMSNYQQCLLRFLLHTTNTF